MPKLLHAALLHAGKKKGLKGRALDRFVYGTMTNIEKEHKSEKKANSHATVSRAMDLLEGDH